MGVGCGDDGVGAGGVSIVSENMPGHRYNQATHCNQHDTISRALIHRPYRDAALWGTLQSVRGGGPTFPPGIRVTNRCGMERSRCVCVCVCV